MLKRHSGTTSAFTRVTMCSMNGVLQYINPITRLGQKKYSFWFPFSITLLSCILLELYAYILMHDPNAVGLLAIFVFIALIIYFAFRDGIKGGAITTVITILYYFYIIYTRHYKGQQLITSIETTLTLGFIYFFLANVIGWLKQNIDTLIEREADEKKRLKAVIQQLPVGVIVTDKKGKIVEANKKVDSILGMKVPLGFTIGEKALMDSQYQGKPTQISRSPLVQTLHTGKPVVGKEYTITRSDKKQVHLQVSAAAIHSNSGKIIAAASIINDITQQKEIEQRKDDFVNMASHELKTPITSMKLYIDSLMARIETYNDERANKTLSNIKNQTERLQKLVNDLLDVSRLQTGKLSFTKEEFRIDTLVEEIIEVLQASTKKQDIVITKKLPLTVFADRFRMYQVITNLITNAIKYSSKGQKINVQVLKKDNKVIVSVEDFGIGIARDQQKKIFERLYQVTDDTEKTFPGFGMGLYISREIVRRNNGAIWVQSEKGKGSTFYFSLPLMKNK